MAGEAFILSLGPDPAGMLRIWGVHVMIGAFLSTTFVLLGRNRAEWNFLDLLAFLLPFATWHALGSIFSFEGKTLGNLAEPIYLSFGIPVAAAIRVVAGPRADKRLMSLSLVALLCLTATGIYLWTPALPE